MLPAANDLVAELEAETKSTRRVLERVPEEHLDWRPHPKSLSLGQLAHHVASIPATIPRLAGLESLDVSTRSFEYAATPSRAALLETLEASVAAAREYLAGMDEETAASLWRMFDGDREIRAFSRIGMMRTMLLNHWYHHRGELMVYLRLLDIPVPAVYGRSADEGAGHRRSE
jgi:uncharacterized damage-inducible protein DinB